MKRSMTWGTWPTREEFDAAFNEATQAKHTGYKITHGILKDDFDARAGIYKTPKELWDELQRLWKLWDPKLENTSERQERAASWVSNILGTLGFEWV